MQVEFYEKPDETIPVKGFLCSLDIRLEAKVMRAIDLLEEFGTELREPVSKHLNEGIFELRASVGKDETRVLYFFHHKGKAILTHGFIKKTQKTPPKEIDKAKEYRTDYLTRNR